MRVLYRPTIGPTNLTLDARSARPAKLSPRSARPAKLSPIGFPSVPIYLRSMGGDLEIWQGKNKLKYSRGLTTNPVKHGKNYYRHTLTFRAKSDTDRTFVRRFIKNCVGYSFYYTDIRSKNWVCTLTNISTPVIVNGRECRNSFTFEMEGVPL